jgi:hypothetical protein
VLVTDKEVFLDDKEKEKRCGAHVVHRFTRTDIEMVIELVEVQVEGPPSMEERCALAAELATAAEEQLPET